MNKNSFTIVSIILIVLLVVYSGNSTAFTMQVSTNKKVYFPNNLIEINTRLETEQLEFVEIENITIQIVGMDEHNSNLKSVCVLKNLDDTEECSRQDERFVSVIISRQDYGYGYYGYGYEFNGVLDIKILWLLKDWITGNYSVMFSATVNGEEYHTNTTIQVRERLGKIAFICRTDACNYNKEPSIINFLTDNGWIVEGKGYWSWGNEIRNYKLIVCADQLKACKIDGSHPAYWAHKAGVAFLELADQPYVNAGWRFGYTKGYIGNSNSESLHITGTHYITQNFSGAVNVLPNTKFAVI
ncbi:MAG: hypothetical protein N2169_06700, partial [bacterium]|nr:hypothetical protein [bacterium]